MWTVGQHGRAIVGLQHEGWQVDVQQLDFAVPQQESNRPACATLPNPRVATTAVKVLIQYITQRLLPLGLMSNTDRRWCQGGEQAVFRTPKRSWKPPATRVAIFPADPCSHRPGRGDKIQKRTTDSESLPAPKLRGHAEAFAGRRLTIGDGRSSALNRQPRNGPLNFSSPQIAKDLRRFVG